ncbi:MAG: dTDP-4-dehydrorhamnose reductase [Candidatus Omnitrophota bacterium]
MAYRINGSGTENIAISCRDTGVPLLYISTDYVFDGNKNAAYSENDATNPVNIYGRSKLQGEKFVKSILNNHLIIRTSWLYGKNSKNFVSGVIERAKRGEELKIVNDQFGSPTWSADLAKAIAKLIDKIKDAAFGAKRLWGIYHVTNAGSCSRYEEAVKTLEYAQLSNTEINPVTSLEADRPAKRPKNSLLENKRYKELFGETLRPWDEALKEYLT